jgi:hypothetical protein
MQRESRGEGRGHGGKRRDLARTSSVVGARPKGFGADGDAHRVAAGGPPPMGVYTRAVSRELIESPHTSLDRNREEKGVVDK